MSCEPGRVPQPPVTGGPLADGPMVPRRRLLGAAVGLAATVATGCGRSDSGSAHGLGSGGPIRVDPADVVRTNWSRDRFALGSYSHQPVGATPELRALLAAPVDNRIFWAGEATSTAAPSTVHGALESGRRAAAEIADGHDGPRRVVVVGAGVAGVAAARDLVELGHDVVILEGRDRVGGRIATARPEGWAGPLELGASWVHSAGAHDLAARLEDAGAGTERWDWDRTTVVGESSDEADGNDDAFESVLVDAVAFAQDREQDRSLQTALEQTDAPSAIDPDPLDARLRVEITTEFGADPADLSASSTFEEGSDGEDRLVLDGYGRLVDQLVDGLDVRLGVTVSRIDRDATGVTVSAESGAAERADAVVVTIPLGVLQSGAVEFGPPLPATTLAAGLGLGMGLLDKVFVRVDEVGHDDTLGWSLTGDGPEPFRDWLNLEPMTGSPVLMALVGGRRARAWSERTDAEVAAGAQASLRRIFGDR